MSRVEEGRLELRRVTVSAGDLVEAAVATAAEGFDAKGVGLTVRVTTRQVLRADPDRMGQVLANLLANALRHTPPGGEVTVCTRPAGSSGVEIKVSDDGEGIADEDLPHLFERFYRGDPARSSDGTGSGIGLTISRAIVEAHGGALVAESAGAGHGAAFVVHLPSVR